MTLLVFVGMLFVPGRGSFRLLLRVLVLIFGVFMRRIFMLIMSRLGNERFHGPGMIFQQVEALDIHEQGSIDRGVGLLNDADNPEGVVLVPSLTMLGIKLVANFQSSIARDSRADHGLKETVMGEVPAGGKGVFLAVPII